MTTNNVLTLEHKLSLLVPFFRLGAQPWEEITHAVLTYGFVNYTGKFTKADVGRVFTVTSPSGQVLVTVNVITLRSEGGIDADVIIKDEGTLLIRETKDIANEGGVTLSFLANGESEENSKFIWNLRADMENKKFFMSDDFKKDVELQVTVSENSANAVDADGLTQINIELTPNYMRYYFPEYLENIEFINADKISLDPTI